MKKIISKYKSELIIFALALIILFITALFTGVFDLKNNSNFVTDANDQYYFFHRLLHERLRSFNFSSFAEELGLGFNFFLLACYYLISPWNLLLILIPLTPNSTEIFMICVMFLNLSIGAGTMSHFIKKKYDLNFYLNSALSFTYALSPFFIIFRYNIMWTFSYALFPLLILFLEELFEKKEHFHIKFIIVFSLATITNFFIAFIFLITMVIFYIFKLLADFHIKKILPLVTNLVSGALISSVIIFVSKDYLFNYYKGTSLPVVDSNFTDSFFNFSSFIKSLFLETRFNISNGSFIIYVGPLVLVIFALRMMVKKRLSKEQLVYLIMTFLVIASFIIPKLDFIFSGFHNNRGIIFRHAFLLPFFLITLAASFTKEITSVKRNYYAFIPILLILAFDFTIFNIIVSLVLFYLLSNINKNELYSKILLVCVLLLVIPLVVKSHKFLITPRIPVSEIRFDGKISIEELADVKKQRDKFGFYQTNNYLYGNSANFRSSTMNNKLAESLYDLGYTIEYEVKYGYITPNPITDMLLGIKFSYYNNSFSNSSIYNDSGSKINETKYLFENGFFSEKLFLDKENSKLPLESKLCFFIEDCNIWNKVDNKEQKMTIEEDGFYYLISDKVIVYPGKRVSKFVSLDYYKKGSELMIPKSVLEKYNTELVYLTEKQVTDIYGKLNNFKINGKVVSVEKPGYYILKEVYDVSLQVMVNNKKVDVINVDDVFAAIYLDEGDNEIEVKYIVKDINKYTIMSLSSITIIGIVAFLKSKKTNVKDLLVKKNKQ